MKKSFFTKVLGYICLAAIFYLLSVATLKDNLRVFSSGFAASLMLLASGNIWVGLCFVAAEVVATLDIVESICAVFTVAVCILGKLLNEKLHLKNKLALSSFYYIVTCLPKVFFVFGLDKFFSAVVYCLLSCGVFVASFVFVSAFLRRKAYLRLNLDEIACGLIVVIGCFCGLSIIQVPYVDFVRIIGVLVILIACYCEMDSLALGLGTVLGIGVCLAGEGIEFIALFSVMAILAKLFKSDIKLFSAVACVCMDIVFGLYFNVFDNYTIFNAISVIVSGAIFMLLPKRFFDYVIINYSKPNNKIAYRNLINQNASETARKMNYLSEVFFDMDLGFRKLVRGELPLSDGKKFFVEELIDDCCKNCENFAECHRKYAVDTQAVFEELANNGFEKGKITLLELPAYITSKCSRIGVLLPTVNGLIKQFKKTSEIVSSEDNSKLLIAEQLRGVSKLFFELSKSTGEKLIFDNKKEVEITEELTYNDIICNEVAVYQKDKNKYRIGVVVRNEDLQNDKLITSIEKACKQKLRVSDISPALISGLATMTLETAPKLDVVFGVAKASKENDNTSGDNYSILKLDNNKFLIAICDGMGSGEKAKNISSKAISLIENFYKAEFDSEIILNSVNKLLNIGTKEEFSTIDICNIDLDSSIVDFIKLGAVESYIKHEEGITKIGSGALPVGVLQEVSPKITKTSLSFGDMVVLVSDGIVDSVGEEGLYEFLQDSDILAPQELADMILNKAKNECKGIPIDDMTVVVGKVFKNT